jgi:hypothetical protein
LSRELHVDAHPNIRIFFLSAETWGKSMGFEGSTFIWKRSAFPNNWKHISKPFSDPMNFIQKAISQQNTSQNQSKNSDQCVM